MKKTLDKKLSVKYREENLIALKPYGLAASLEPHRPVFIFKSDCETYTVGVPLSPLEAGISITQNHHQGPASSPHGLSIKALKELGIQPTRCIFKEVRGHFLYVEVEFTGDDRLIRIESRADEAISFCMKAGAKFYSTIETIQACKELESATLQESAGVQTTLNIFERSRNKHPYLM